MQKNTGGIQKSTSFSVKMTNERNQRKEMKNHEENVNKWTDKGF